MLNRIVRTVGFSAVTLCLLGAFGSTAFGQLIISEFRVRGPNGANDEFIELYNNSGADHTVAGGGTGYAVAASNGVARCVIPNGTVIPNRGHYLCVNSIGYSLASYPAGNGTTATGDATYTTDIPDNAGIAIFNTSVAANWLSDLSSFLMRPGRSTCPAQPGISSFSFSICTPSGSPFEGFTTVVSTAGEYRSVESKWS